MRIISSMQRRLGFTQNEARAVLFLASTLLAGLAIRWYDEQAAAPQRPGYDYREADSIFALRAGMLAPSPRPARPARPGGVRATLADSSIRINAASQEELLRLPGIGPAYAARIVSYRAAHGPFRSVQELRNVKGIGAKRLEKLRRYIILGTVADTGSVLHALHPAR